MPSRSRSLALIGMALGLVVVVYVGGKFAMSETSSVDEPAQPSPKSETGTDGKDAKEPDAHGDSHRHVWQRLLLVHRGRISASERSESGRLRL